MRRSVRQAAASSCAAVIRVAGCPVTWTAYTSASATPSITCVFTYRIDGVAYTSASATPSIR